MEKLDDRISDNLFFAKKAIQMTGVLAIFPLIAGSAGLIAPGLTLLTAGCFGYKGVKARFERSTLDDHIDRMFASEENSGPETLAP